MAWTARDIDVGGETDVGQVREQNEDDYSIPSDLERQQSNEILCIVADGMGGHAGGEVASRIATEVIRSDLSGRSGMESVQALRSAVLRADREILRQAEAERAYEGMGSTVVVLLLQEEKAFVASVGDSRAYLARSKRLKRITVDHTLAQEQRMSAEKARNAGISSVLTRAMGRGIEEENIDVFSIPLKEGDSFLLCSDGLTGHVDDASILGILQKPRDSKTLCRQLIEQANALGGRDNITAVVVKVGEKRQRGRRGWSSVLRMVGIAVASFLVGFTSHWLLEKKAENLERIGRRMRELVHSRLVRGEGKKDEAGLKQRESERTDVPSAVPKESTEESQTESGAGKELNQRRSERPSVPSAAPKESPKAKEPQTERRSESPSAEGSQPSVADSSEDGDQEQAGISEGDAAEETTDDTGEVPSAPKESQTERGSESPPGGGSQPSVADSSEGAGSGSEDGDQEQESTEGEVSEEAQTDDTADTSKVEE